MSDQDGLICAYRLNGEGGAAPLGWNDLDRPGEGPLWIHLHPEKPEAENWLRKKSGIDPILLETLLDDENQPRRVVAGEEILITMRGVNLNPGADPEDMVFVNLWIGANRIITLRTQRLMAVQDLRDDLEAGRGPKNAGDFLNALIHRLSIRMEPALTRLDDALDDLEEQVLAEEQEGGARENLANLRHEIIGLRRHLAPQRELLANLREETQLTWLGAAHHRQLREAGARAQRTIGNLDAARDRALLIQDELSRLLNERMNRAMYLLSVVTGIFLPLGLLTGLLGINVGGMPGVDNPFAFWGVCLVLLACAGFTFWLLKKLKWI